MTVREFTDHIWYVQPILVITWQDFDAREREDIEELKKKALLYGDNCMVLSSETAKSIMDKKVDSYGVIDNVLIILVHR